VNVTNKAPYFSNNITGYNYSAFFIEDKYIPLPSIISPNLGYPLVRVTSG